MDYSYLSFGTAGIRGIMGDGPGEINKETVAVISHGLAQVWRKKYDGGTVVFCYDSRHNGKVFAECAAGVLSDYGFSCYVSEEPAPTPFLSYAVKTMKAVGGVNITASHNPKEYTGYKVYGADGIQIDVAAAEEVQDSIWSLTEAPLSEKLSFSPIPSDVYDSYIDTIIANNNLDDFDFYGFRASFTPLCGSSGSLMRQLAAKASLPLDFVETEMKPNGDFPDLPTPNPDDAGVFAKSLSGGGQTLLLANDPDGDRLGAMIRTATGCRLLSGNEIGILLLWYLLENSDNLQSKYIVKSIVSTEFVERLAAAYGVSVKNVLVGFRYIAQKAKADPDSFLFGFEESGGYLAHSHAGDKDGIEAACLLLKAAAQCYRRGLTLEDVLNELYSEYGKIDNHTLTIDIPLSDSKKIMVALRDKRPGKLGGRKIIDFQDYAVRDDELKGELISMSTESYKVILRPSGTEPKMKVYITAYTDSCCAEADIREMVRLLLDKTD